MAIKTVVAHNMQLKIQSVVARSYFAQKCYHLQYEWIAPAWIRVWPHKAKLTGHLVKCLPWWKPWSIIRTNIYTHKFYWLSVFDPLQNVIHLKIFMYTVIYTCTYLACHVLIGNNLDDLARLCLYYHLIAHWKKFAD